MAIRLFGGASAEQPAMFSNSPRHARRSSSPRFGDWHVARAVTQDRCRTRFSSFQISYGLHQTTVQYLTLLLRTARCSAPSFAWTGMSTVVTPKQLLPHPSPLTRTAALALPRPRFGRPRTEMERSAVPPPWCSSTPRRTARRATGPPQRESHPR
ncbi:hypothetical protein FB45DRAFT_445434 [Roridomyces roridus]|uniref:Uncharacterized protein n=1 Tax=Roridomyces roridus TaxID=1738132 RepID=A0AAD7C0X9_9AGAR|nr:hypothetical protein FB45DRAFT_445434 [Roridomyces roridus]